jgi:hypothetical protein
MSPESHQEINSFALTKEEFAILSRPTHPDFEHVMAEKGMEFTEAIPVTIDGKREVIVGTLEDFGTVLEPEGYLSLEAAELYEKWTGIPYKRLDKGEDDTLLLPPSETL